MKKQEKPDHEENLSRTVEHGIGEVINVFSSYFSSVYTTFRGPLRASSAYAEAPDRYSGPHTFLLIGAILALWALYGSQLPSPAEESSDALTKMLLEATRVHDLGLPAATFAVIFASAVLGSRVVSSLSHVTDAHGSRTRISQSIFYLIGLQLLLFAATYWLYSTRRPLQLFAVPFVRLAALFKVHDPLSVGLLLMQNALVGLRWFSFGWPTLRLLMELPSVLPQPWIRRLPILVSVVLVAVFAPGGIFVAPYLSATVSEPAKPVTGAIIALTSRSASLLIQNNTGVPLPLVSHGTIAVLRNAETHEVRLVSGDHDSSSIVLAAGTMVPIELLFVNEEDGSAPHEISTEELKLLQKHELQIAVDVPDAFRPKVRLRAIVLRCPPFEPDVGTVSEGKSCTLTGTPSSEN